MLDKLPAELVAGDTWSWSRALGDYPQPTWTSIVYFENADGTFSQAATASGTDHLFTIAAETTAGKKPGRYRWSVRVTDGTSTFTAETGWIEILTDPAAAGAHDPRSDARKMLDALEATLLGRASSDQLAMTINGRSISRTPLEELIKWRDRLKQEVKTEEQGARGSGRDIKVRYGAS